MRANNECTACGFTWVYERTAPYVAESMRQGLAEEITRAVYSEPQFTNVGLLSNRAAYSVTDFESRWSAHYQTFKERSNNQAERLLPLARTYIESGKTEQERIERACILAAASNVAPLGAPSAAFTFPEVTAIVEGITSGIVMGDLYGTILAARRVFYVTDNAGEVGFDSLVVRAVKDRGARVTLVVKEDTFFEDARISDARHFHLDELVDEIITSRGFPVPGMLTSRLADAYGASDVVIAKGTGSFEALKNETAGKRAIFMLKVKCGPISRETGVEQGRVLVKVE
ncbi:MAG: ARMT1-like domain-containing protein [Syntrophorhabdales bacterium]